MGLPEGNWTYKKPIDLAFGMFYKAQLKIFDETVWCSVLIVRLEDGIYFTHINPNPVEENIYRLHLKYKLCEYENLLLYIDIDYKGPEL